MPVLLQVCVVIVTIGVLVLALQTARMMARFLTKATADISQLTGAVRESVDQIDLVTREARELVASLRGCVQPVQRVAARLEAVGQRTADISSTILEEIALPVLTAAAVTRGMRVGANHLLKRLTHRFTNRNSPLNGDHNE